VYSMVFSDLPALRLRDAAHYDFSPSGDQIVLRMPADRSDAKLGAGLVVVSNGGVVLRTLVPARREVGLNNPRWSPDGKYIAYREASWVGADTSFGAIKVIPAEGGPVRIVTTQHYGLTGARGGFFWTPDSRGLTVVARKAIVTMDLAGKVIRTVPFEAYHLTQVTGYSPDGRWLAFHKLPPGTQLTGAGCISFPTAAGARTSGRSTSIHAQVFRRVSRCSSRRTPTSRFATHGCCRVESLPSP
jgi:dipeptidyl aminopeptidase/acylaminoacyl peptidase